MRFFKLNHWLLGVFTVILIIAFVGLSLVLRKDRLATKQAEISIPISSVSQTTLTLTMNTPVLAGLEAIVYKSPTCGCCSGYVAFLEAQGVTVKAVDTSDLAQVKADYGIPAAARSCHTTLIDGYVVEGHVPLEGLEQLLSVRPEVDGIALPGMPTGTPGMPGPKQGPLEVLTLQNGQLGLWERF